MWLIRIWLIFVAALAAVALAAATLATVPGDRDRTAAHGHKLDLVQHNAHLLLKLDQRENIDVVAHMARDARIVEVLATVTGKKDPPPEAPASANAALLDLLAQIPADSRPELCILVDAKGRQLARVGPGEGRFEPLRHGLIGYPLVSRAVRGMLRDDAWSLDGKLYLMAGAPVISRAMDSYVGAMLIGKEVTTAYAQRLKERLVATHVPFLAQTDVAFFLRGQQLAATIDEEPLRKLPRRFSKHRADYLKAERSAPLHVGTGSASYLVVMAPIEGEAAAHDAFYAIVTPAPTPAGLVGTLARIGKGDLYNTQVLVAAGSAFGLLLAIGLLLSVLRSERPLRRLTTDLRRLARGELMRLPQHRYGGSFNVIAALVTEAVDRVTKRASATSGSRSPNSAVPMSSADGRSEVLDLEPMPAQSAPPLAPLSAGPAREAQGGPIPLAAPSPAQPLPPLGPPRLGNSPLTPHPALGDPDDGVQALLPSSIGRLVESSEEAVTDHIIGSVRRQGDADAPPPTDFGADLPLLKPIDLPDTDQAMEADTIAEGGPGGSTIWPSGAGQQFGDGPGIQMDTVSASPLPAELPTTTSTRPPSIDEERDTVMSSVPQHLARSIKDRTPTPAIERVASPDSPGDAFEGHISQVFKDFVSIKRSCGESTDNLTFDRFAAKLRKNRDALLERYECKSVRFKVYVKDGKAALKATPIQDDES